VLKAADIADSWPECARVAERAIDSGAARRALETMAAVSNEVRDHS